MLRWTFRGRMTRLFPGQNYTYTWLSKPDHGPTPADPDCLTWIYHSHVDAVRDVAAGLIGPLIVCKKGALLNPDKLTAPHFFIMFSVVDENLSWYLEENVKRFCSNPSSVDVDDEDFQESNKMHSINGYVYGNLKGLEMCAGADVTWHLVGMGNEVDIHSAFFHGATLVSKYHRVDNINLFPATFVTAHQKPVKPGTWLLSCNINDHILAGMQALYHVNNCGWKVSAEPVGGGKQREYFIAAQEVIWNYGPGGINNFNGQPLDKPGSDSAPFFDHESNHLGGSYWKAVFRGYTDANFFTQQNRSPKEAHMGLLGPAIRAEVGDSLSVTFFNNATYTYSIQVHGLSYNKENEGVPYQDNVPGEHGNLNVLHATAKQSWGKFTVHCGHHMYRHGEIFSNG
uniref:Plastocyanin-like domain-containing protein n=1 Tax=Eptatretus burgeri TaxID=7764 RepID=A0A8C4QM48_EPTBU